jgi:Mg-chelatase subunit ChlD
MTGSGEGEGEGVPGNPDLVDEDGNVQKGKGGEGKGVGKGAGMVHGAPRIADEQETAKVDAEAATSYINEHYAMHRELAREMANAMGGELRDGPKIRLPSEARGRINTAALVERLTDSEGTQPLYVSRKPGHKVQGRKIFQTDMVISVVDGSGSMCGEPIQTAKSIISGIMSACVQNKIPFLSAVNYNNVTHILADGRCDMPSRIESQRKIMAIGPSGGTDMAGASILTMVERAGEVARVRGSESGRIVFVTDGRIYGPETVETALGCISALSMPTIVIVAREGSYAQTAKDADVRWIAQAVKDAAEAGGASGCTMFFDASDRESVGISFSAFCRWMRSPDSVARKDSGILDPTEIGRPMNLPLRNFEYDSDLGGRGI